MFFITECSQYSAHSNKMTDILPDIQPILRRSKKRPQEETQEKDPKKDQPVEEKKEDKSEKKPPVKRARKPRKTVEEKRQEDEQKKREEEEQKGLKDDLRANDMRNIFRQELEGSHSRRIAERLEKQKLISEMRSEIGALRSQFERHFPNGEKNDLKEALAKPPVPKRSTGMPGLFGEPLRF